MIEQATELPVDGVTPAGNSARGKVDAAKYSDMRVHGEGIGFAAIGKVGESLA